MKETHQNSGFNARRKPLNKKISNKGEVTAHDGECKTRQMTAKERKKYGLPPLKKQS